MLDPAPITWLPSPQQVADMLRARTKDDQGEEIGAWTANTRPTEHEVKGLIDTAAGDLLAAVDTLPEDWEDPHGSAAALCARRAAMFIELSYWPEQAAQPGSVYVELRDQWDAGVRALINALAGPPQGGSTYSVQVPTSTAQLAGFWPWWILNLPEPETTQPIFEFPPDPPGGKVVIGGSPPGRWSDGRYW
jgi:hypothetical protein